MQAIIDDATGSTNTKCKSKTSTVVKNQTGVIFLKNFCQRCFESKVK